MTALQARLFAARAVRAAQDQEELARRIRPEAQVPSQRVPEDFPRLILVPKP